MRTWPLVAILCVLSCVAGCDDGDTVILGGGGTGAFVISTNFPARVTAANNMGDDGRAFNDSFALFAFGYINVFWNCDNGTAIVMFVDRFGHLWASFFDGTNLNPLTELKSPNQDFDIETGDSSEDNNSEFMLAFRVLWLNTATRNGDALLLWLCERGSDGHDTDGPNVLFGTYFDSSRASTARTTDPASSDEIRWGFYPGSQVSDGTIDVTNFGFISDSLKYSHTKYVRETEDIDVMPLAERSGDPTTFVHFFWRRDDGNNNSQRFTSLAFNLTQTAGAGLSENRLPSGAGTEFPEAPGQPLTGDASNKVVVHNGNVIWRAPGTLGPLLHLTRFGTGITDTIVLGTEWAPGSEPASEIPLAEDVYAGDHGLTSLYAFFLENGGTGDSVMCAKSDLDAKGLSRELADIDAGAADVDHFAFAGERQAARWNGTRINRTGEWIFVMWTQLAPTMSLAHCNVVQTRTGPGARTLADSVATAAQVPNQDPALGVRDDFPSSFRDVFPRIGIQYEIADGTSGPGTGIQSNRFRMNFTIRQLVTAGNSGDDKFLWNGVNMTLGAAAAAPTFAFEVTGASPAGEIETARRLDEHEIVADRGTSEGDPVIYFLRASNANMNIRLYGWTPGVTGPILVSTDPGTDNRLYADVNRAHIHTTPVGLNQLNDYSGDNLHVFFTEPPFIGGEGPSGQTIDAEGKSLRTRYFDKSAFAGSILAGVSSDAAFRAAHVPSLTGNPVTLDHGIPQENTFLPPPIPDSASTPESPGGTNPNRDRDNIGPIERFVTSSGNMVGVFFRTRQNEINEGGHIYYNQFNGTSWYSTSDGDPDPQPVDVFDFNTGLFGGQGNGYHLFPPPVEANNGNTMSDTMAFWMKPQVNDAAVGKWRRLYVQIHD